MSTTIPLRPPETHPSALENWEQILDDMFEEVFRPRPHLTVSQWAEQRRILSSETSAEPGPWRNDRTPYLVEIMDALSDPEVTEMVIQKSARVGYTEGVVGNGIGYFIDQDPCPVLVLQPSEGDAEDWSKKQLTPMIRDCPALAEKFPPPGIRDSANTILDKTWPGGSITVRGAHSPRGLRRLTVRVCFMDEVSGFELSAGAEGDPVKLAEQRTATYPNRKIVKGSTPVDKARCRITKDFLRSDQRYWHVPCPHCGREQVLRWGGPDKPFGIKWEREVRCHRCKHLLEEGDGERCPKCKGGELEVKHLPETAYYLCEQCATPIEEVQKEWMVQHGRFIPTNPESKVPGWHIDSLHSLISDKARWPNLVQEWLDAQEDPELLQVFVNTALGEPWEDRGKKFTPDQLGGRAEVYVNSKAEVADVPDGVGLLTAFVDVQDSWLEVLVRGWGDREESWGILHHRIHRDPQTLDAWQMLEAIRTRPYRHQAGGILRIRSMLVDAGDKTPAVAAYVKPREPFGVYASVGRAGKGKSAVNRGTKPGKDGVRFFTLGIDGLKDRLFARLRIGKPGPGYYHFPRPDFDRFNGFDGEFFAQFGAEKKVRKKRRGRAVGSEEEYIKIRDRNEAIDLEVGNLGALYVLGSPAELKLGQLAREISRRGEQYRDIVGAPVRGRRMRSRGVR